MALYKRKKIYWVNINHNGTRIQRSTGTSEKLAAQEFHDKVKADLWRQNRLGDKPKRTWMEAVVRWLNESTHKKSLHTDKDHLKWLHPHLSDKKLIDINREMIEEIANKKSATGVSDARVNRVLALIRSILNRAVNQWEWLDSAPKIKLRKESGHRMRWLTRSEAKKLIAQLPSHLADMAIFTLATGLRQSNVKNLKWQNVDLSNKHAWVNADEAKGAKAISVPLNLDALAILKRRLGTDPKYVFTYKGKPVFNVSTKAWTKALKRAEIENFCWHDLRHTWASWHVQNGTTLQELQILGGWSSFVMVLRYAHLSSSHLRVAADRIYVTNLLHDENRDKDCLIENRIAA
ncbi:MAG: site-specific integrase [Gammaproteobacteria bacterium]|nr:site-specific integrase [Gammaproteobacteria bacterium]